MSADDPFAALVRGVRAGDPDAATELVRRYEPLIRREVRLRMEDPRLNRLFDTDDVCQSVLASFFVRASAGQFDLDSPDGLGRLLVRMARNKLASVARAQSRQRRDHRRVGGGDDTLAGTSANDPTPSRVVAGKEILERFRAALSPEERAIADLRGDGLSWAEVAEQLGGTAQARRMQLARAVERAAQAVGLEPEPDLETP